MFLHLLIVELQLGLSWVKQESRTPFYTEPSWSMFSPDLIILRRQSTNTSMPSLNGAFSTRWSRSNTYLLRLSLRQDSGNQRNEKLLQPCETSRLNYSKMVNGCTSGISCMTVVENTNLHTAYRIIVLQGLVISLKNRNTHSSETLQPLARGS